MIKHKFGLMNSFALVRPYTTGRVLDLGCDGGKYIQKFRKDSVGIDTHEENIEKCRKMGYRCDTYDLNKGIPQYKGRFDTVFMSHILEHLENPIQLIREARNTMNNDALLVIGLPIEGSLLTSHYDYFSKQHNYSFTPNNIRHILKNEGYNVIKFFYEFPRLPRLLLELYQRFPDFIKRRVSNAYWVVAHADGWHNKV